MYGGQGEKGSLGDIWLFEHHNHQYGEWTKLHESRDIQRFGHSLCVYKNDKFIVFGGKNSQNFLNDVIIFDFDEKSEKVKLETRNTKNLNVPIPRYDHSAVILNDELFIFGGLAKTTQTYCLNDLWSYNITQNIWKKIVTNCKPPSARYGHLMGVIDQNLIIYGGYNSTTEIWMYLSKQNIWKTADLLEENPLSPDPYYHSFSYVFYRENFLIFGGKVSDKDKKDIKTINDFYLCVTNLKSKPLQYKEWIIKKRIGGGSFSDVYQVYKSDSPNEYFAMKVSKDLSNDFEIEKWDEQLSEVFSQSKMNHQNCLPVLEFFHHLGKLCIIMPLCDFTLSYFLDEKKKEYQHYKLKGEKKSLEIFESTLLSTIIGILKGLDHIHSNGLLHLDLKPGNILMKKDSSRKSMMDNVKELYIPKISDFGFSTSIDKINNSVNKGTLGFIAPDEKFTMKSDIYSFGVILYCIFTLNAYHKSHELEKRTLLDEIQENYTWGKTYVKLIEKCCSKDFKDRPSALELLKDFENKYQLLVGKSKNFNNFSTPPNSSRQRDKSPKSTDVKKVIFSKPISHSNSYDTLEYALKSINLIQYKEKFEKKGIEMHNSFVDIPKEKIIDVEVSNILHKRKIVQFITESQKIIDLDTEFLFHKWIKDNNLLEYQKIFENHGLKNLQVLKSLTKEEIEKLEIPSLESCLNNIEIDIKPEMFTFIRFWLQDIGLSQYKTKFDINDEVKDLLSLDKNEMDHLLKKIFENSPLGHEKLFLIKLKEQSKLWNEKLKTFQ